MVGTDASGDIAEIVTTGLHKIFKAGKFALKLQFERQCGAIAVFADHNIRFPASIAFGLILVSPVHKT